VAHDSVPVGPARLWRELTIRGAHRAGRRALDDGESAQQQAEAVQLIRAPDEVPAAERAGAGARETRPLSRGAAQVSESMPTACAVVYHLSAQRPMLEAFLTRLGIAHEEG